MALNTNGNTNEGMKLARLRLYRAQAEADYWQANLRGVAGKRDMEIAKVRYEALDREIAAFERLTAEDSKQVPAPTPPAYTSPHPADAYGAALGGK